MNTLVIQALDEITDASMRKLGEIRFPATKQGTGATKTTINLTTNGAVTFKLLSGNGYFADTSSATSGTTTKTLASGVHTFYLKLNADDVICIENAMNITMAGNSSIEQFFKTADVNSPLVEGDISEFEMMPEIIGVFLSSTAFKGDIAALASCTKIAGIYITDTKITGDIAALSKMSNLTGIYANRTPIYGDISALANKSITSCSMTESGVYGNISVMSTWTNIVGATVSFNTTRVSGNVSSIGSNILYFSAWWANLSGDLAGVASTTRQLDLSGIIGSFSYTGGQNVRFTNPQEFKLGSSALSTSDLDNLLISLSKSTWSGNKLLSLKGARSSASDSAISTLQTNGVTVTITA